jgi:hypothetical protein
MSLREALDVLQKISEIATLAGFKCRVDEDRMHVEMGIGLPGDRSQVIYIRPTAKSMDEAVIVTVFSPCLTVEKGFLKGISKEQALELLKENENLLFARYGIWSSKEEDMIVASVDHLLDTFDPDELKTSTLYVALAADAYEKKHSKEDRY